MAGERQTLWISAAAAGATLAAVAVAAFVMWNVTGKQRTQFMAELSAINGKLEASNTKLEATNAKLETANAKIDKASMTVAEIKKTTALENTTQQLDLLNAAIKKTNEDLAQLQQASSLDGIKSALTQLETKIDKTSAALTEVKTSNAGASAKVDLSGLESSLASLSAKIETGAAARDKAIADLKADIAGKISAQGQSLEALAGTVDTIKTAAEQRQAADKQASERLSVQSKDQTKAESGDLVVVYAPAQATAPETTSSIPGAANLSIRFEKIGSTNPAGKIEAVVASLKDVMKDRRDCSISVAGFADTLGSDAVNLDVSRERAEAVAAKLRSAFAGHKVSIRNVAWGERQLKVWTPDGRSEKANRRVDISVDCNG